MTGFHLRAYPQSVSDASDRRDDQRAPIELKVEYKKMNTFFADYTKNISKGGTFIKTDRPLPLGTEFLFKLTLPKREAPFELLGRVIWTNRPEEVQNPEIDAMGMGIRFIFSADEERLEFEKQVEGLMVESLGEHLFSKLVTSEQ